MLLFLRMTNTRVFPSLRHSSAYTRNWSTSMHLKVSSIGCFEIVLTKYNSFVDKVVYKGKSFTYIVITCLVPKTIFLTKPLTMKQGNLPWLQDIQYLQWEIGLGNIWLLPEKWDMKSLKIITSRLKYIYPIL